LERLGKCDKTNNNHIVTAAPMQMSQSDDRYYKIFILVVMGHSNLCIFVFRDVLAFVLFIVLYSFDLFHLYQVILVLISFLILLGQISIEVLGKFAEIVLI